MGDFIMGVICGSIGTILLLYGICGLIARSDADRRSGYDD